MNPNYNITQEELEYIERYINNNMKPDELAGFEEKLNNNPDFKNQVEDIKTLLLGIETQALTEKIETFHNELPDTKSPKEQPSKVRHLDFRKWVAAAAVIIAVGSFWFFNGNSNSKLYSKYYAPDPGLPTTMSTQDNFVFYDAMVNYKRQDYQLAINKWQPLLTNKPENDTLNYFMGSAYLAKGETTTAISYLEKVTELKESAFKNDAFYYLGLAYLKNNKIELAKETLKQSNMADSKAILSELED